MEQGNDIIREKIEKLGLDKIGVKSFIQKEAEAKKIREPKTDHVSIASIKLMNTRIAGTSHISKIKDLAKCLEIGSMLNLKHENTNENDWNAVLLLTQAGEKLGYLPREDNRVVSKLIEGGKILHAEVQGIEMRSHWVDISITVFLDN